MAWMKSESDSRWVHKTHTTPTIVGVVWYTEAIMDEARKGSMNLPESKLPWGQQMGEMPLDFRSSFHWRVFRIMSEFVDGWQFITDYKNTVSILGSARFTEDNKWYQVARELGALLAKKKIGVVTGAGPGIMEGGNRGAYESGGESIGISIRLPFEQRKSVYHEEPAVLLFLRAQSDAVLHRAGICVLPGRVRNAGRIL